MPVISMFYGILIRMFFRDTEKHHVPHIHADSLLSKLAEIPIVTDDSKRVTAFDSASAG